MINTSDFDHNDPCNAQCSEVLAFILGTEAGRVFDGTRALRVLELGCGSGPLGRRLLAEYPSITVTGVDVLPESVEELQRIIARQGLGSRYEAMVGDIGKAGLFEPDSFDVILAPCVLHHFERLSKLTVPDNIRLWLKPGGYLVIDDPNGANPVQRFSNQVMRIAVRYVKSWRRYKWLGETMYAPSYYRRVFGQCGFEILESRVINPLAPVRGIRMPLVLLRNVLINLVSIVTWGDWRGTGQMLLFRKK